MALRYESEELVSIPVSEMRSGQVGRIVSWGSASGYVGAIVKRNGRTLVGLTGPECWPEILEGDRYRVKLLEDGTKFVVVDNEG